MIPYVREIQFEYGACDQVSPLIRRVVANNPGPFTYLGTGTYIIGKGEVAVIDPGPDMPEHLDALMAALEGETVTHILVTHHHSDHSPLAGPLQEKTGAKIYGCAVGAKAGDSAVITEAGHDLDFSPDIDICGGGAVFEGPGWTLEAIATPGHTSNHLCFALPETKALFSGDHVMGWSTAVISPPDGNMADYFNSLRKLLPRDESLYIPTHGAEIRDPNPFVQAYIEHRLGREAQIIARLKDGPQTIPQMVAKNYADTPVHLHPAAGRSMLAHLVQMVKDGRVKTEDGRAAIDSVYRL